MEMVTSVIVVSLCQIVLLFEVFVILKTIDLFKVTLTDLYAQKTRIRNYFNFKGLTFILDLACLVLIAVFKLLENEHIPFSTDNLLFFLIIVQVPMIYLGQIWIPRQIKNDNNQYIGLLAGQLAVDSLRGMLIVILLFIIIGNYVQIFLWSVPLGAALLGGSAYLFLRIIQNRVRVLQKLSSLFSR